MAADLKRSVHCEPTRTGYIETDAERVRMVSADYPLPTFPNTAAITAGSVAGWSVVHKFGSNVAVGTSYVPICRGGIYRTPQVSGATALRVKAGGNANDTAAGSGARAVTLEGLDQTGALASETIATAGSSASAATTTTFLRLFRAYVSSSGTYATASAGSHAATITIEDAAGTQNWATLSLSGFAEAQSFIGAYSVPLGKVAFVRDIEIYSDTTKTSDIIFFKRENILETAAPYSPMRAQTALSLGAAGQARYASLAPLGPFPALTDIGVLGKVNSATAGIDINFDIWLQDV